MEKINRLLSFHSSSRLSGRFNLVYNISGIVRPIDAWKAALSFAELLTSKVAKLLQNIIRVVQENKSFPILTFDPHRAVSLSLSLSISLRTLPANDVWKKKGETDRQKYQWALHNTWCYHTGLRATRGTRSSEPVLWRRRKKNDGQTRHKPTVRHNTHNSHEGKKKFTLSNYFANTLLTLRVEIV